MPSAHFHEYAIKRLVLNLSRPAMYWYYALINVFTGRLSPPFCTTYCIKGSYMT